MLKSKLGIKKALKKILKREKRFISLAPVVDEKGKVLLSYLVKPFIVNINAPDFSSHSNYWECFQIAQTFLNFGFRVDVINWYDKTFIPKKDYAYIIDIHSNLERLFPYLSKDCKKILHVTGSHWLFQNYSEYKRLLDLQKRKNKTLLPVRVAPPGFGIEYADYISIIGNKFTKSTFAYSKKTLTQIPLSSTSLYPSPENKVFNKVRNNYLWIGSSGMVHKGLDLVLEAFSEMPEYQLTVCGPVKNEKDFNTLYFKELYQTKNINCVDWIDTASKEFEGIINSCIGLVYPSCSEGQAGSVINCMQAGLIPIVSFQSGVDVDDFGTILRDCTIEEIKQAVRNLSSQPDTILQDKSRRTWEYARQNHSRERFSKTYNDFVEKILKDNI
jgi:glycosyltransferase involved in cell wall biosynthesis